MFPIRAAVSRAMAAFLAIGACHLSVRSTQAQEAGSIAPAVHDAPTHGAVLPPLVRKLEQAWHDQNVDAVQTLFRQDAGIAVSLLDPDGFVEYGGQHGVDTLRSGIQDLLASGPHLHIATAHVEHTIFGGEPATALRWTYAGSPEPLNLPPVSGYDEVVVLANQIVSYRRFPDHGVQIVRLRKVLDTLKAQQLAGVTQTPPSRLLSRTRTVETEGYMWPAVAGALALIGTLFLRIRSHVGRRVTQRSDSLIEGSA